MQSLLLLLFLLGTWCVWVVACYFELLVREARSRVPQEQRGGVSIFPGFPIFPLIFWGAALLANGTHGSWGTWLIGIAHVVLLTQWLLGIAWSWFCLRALKRSASS